MSNVKENPQRNVEQASRSKNPMEFMVKDLKYEAVQSANNENYTLKCLTKNDADQKLIKWAFKLAERSVGPFYKQLKMGWQPKIKQNELSKTWARYLVAMDSKGNPVGYIMFRFDLDDGCSVLYCYEIHVEASHQRRGLGKFMMHALELCSAHWNMEKTILTVLKNNKISLDFFKSMGYQVDYTSPDDTECEYEILSKLTPINAIK